MTERHACNSSTAVDKPVDNAPAKALAGWLRRTDYGWGAFPCWQWKGHIRGDGYGTIGVQKLRWPRVAHRAIYELLVRPLESAEVLEHLCRHRSCVCPWHLEPVTRSESGRRARGDRRIDWLRVAAIHRDLWTTCFATVENAFRASSSTFPAHLVHRDPNAGPAETAVTNISTTTTRTKELEVKKDLDPQELLESVENEAWYGTRGARP